MRPLLARDSPLSALSLSIRCSMFLRYFTSSGIDPAATATRTPTPAPVGWIGCETRGGRSASPEGYLEHRRYASGGAIRKLPFQAHQMDILELIPGDRGNFIPAPLLAYSL